MKVGKWPRPESHDSFPLWLMTWKNPRAEPTLINERCRNPRGSRSRSNCRTELISREKIKSVHFATTTISLSELHGGRGAGIHIVRWPAASYADLTGGSSAILCKFAAMLDAMPDIPRPRQRRHEEQRSRDECMSKLFMKCHGCAFGILALMALNFRWQPSKSSF